MFDRWTYAARMVVFYARREAGMAGAEQIDTEDLLLALLLVDPEAVERVGAMLTVQGVRAGARRWRSVSAAAIPDTVDLPVSDDVKRLFEDAEAMAPADRCRYIRTEHLLWAMVAREGHAAQMLTEAGADAVAIQVGAEAADCAEQQMSSNADLWPMPDTEL